MAKASTAPTTISPIDPMKGQSQFPVTSMIQPPITGLEIAANAEPMFMNPLAVPEYFGAMSIGIAHMGPIVSSAKKKPKLKQIAAMVESWMNNIGSSEASAPKLHTTTMHLRPRERLPVRDSSHSVMGPPSQSPRTP